MEASLLLPPPPALAIPIPTRALYTSHFLSTFNARIFEFGAVLFLADLFPGTLLPVSIYALVRAASAILLSHAVGHYVDTGDRLQVVRTSIGGYWIKY
jgi:iron-regulated transporter 1